MDRPLASLVILGALLLVPGCGDTVPRDTPDVEPAHGLLADAVEVRLDRADGALAKPLLDAADALGLALEKEPTLQALVVAQPDEGATIVGDGEPPRFLWRDPAEAADTWWVEIRFGTQRGADLRLLLPGGMPAEAALDPFSATAQAWTPSAGVWTDVVAGAKGAAVVVTFVGFAADAPSAPLSRGSVTLAVTGAR